MDQIGKYIILDEIGQGGMGVVYRARDPIIGREVAVKVIPERIMRSPDLRDRFLREIASAGRLSHENIMTIYDAGDHEERPYFVMELLSGTDLSAAIRKDTLSFDQKLDVALQVAQGLRYAHRHGVIHRDIKPDNVRLLDNGRAKIMDFGIARVESATRTPTHSAIGTPRYMSPEQIKAEPIDQRTDIFSFGAVLYELLAGSPPFFGERITTVMYMILHDDPAPLDLGDEVGGEALCGIVERCLEKETEPRYPNFEAVIRDLQTVVSERNTSGPTITAVSSSGMSAEPDHDETVLAMPPLDPDPTVAVPASSLEPTIADSSPSAAKPVARTSEEGNRRHLIRWGGIGLVGLAALFLLVMVARSGGEPEDVVSPVVVPDESEQLVATADSMPQMGSGDMETVPPVEPEAPTPTPPERVDPPASNNREEASDDEADAAAERERAQREAAQRAEADQRRAEQRQAERRQAEQAQEAMEQARTQILPRRSEAEVTEAFQQAEGLRTVGLRQFDGGEFGSAEATFAQARTAYAAAAEIAPTPEPEPEEAAPDEPEGPSPEEVARAAADQAARTYASRLKRALEQEDAGAMRQVNAFYSGWDGFFRAVENVSASVNVTSLRMQGDQAVAQVAARIQYQNTTTNRQESQNPSFTWTLEPRGDAWVLTNVASR